MTDKELKNIIHSNNGSAIIVFIGFMMVMCLLITLVSGPIGEMLYDKIRLQVVADAAGLAAGNVQSTGLNEIADLNRELSLEYKKLKNILETCIWTSVFDGKAAINYYKSIFKQIHQYQNEANKAYAKLAMEVAENVIEQNQPEDRNWILVPDSVQTQLANLELERLQRPVHFTYTTGGCLYCPPITTTSWADGLAGLSHYIGEHDGRFPAINQIPILEAYEQLSILIRKTEDPTEFGLTLIQNPRKFKLGALKIFGLMPELKAYVKVKPTGGNIYEGNPDYQPVVLK